MAETPEKYVVITCPNDQAHEKPKILCFAKKNTKGTVYVQCRDRKCKQTSGNKSWFGIRFNGIGGFTIRKMPAEYYFHNEPVPVAVMEG
jgi:hypothetical protein